MGNGEWGMGNGERITQHEMSLFPTLKRTSQTTVFSKRCGRN